MPDRGSVRAHLNGQPLCATFLTEQQGSGLHLRLRNRTGGHMRKRLAAILLACMMLLLPCAPASADGGFSEDPERMEQTAGSVLLLYIFDDRSELIATGSGFLMFDNRTLVTNCHVIEDADSVWGESDDGYDYILTRVLITDSEKDIAILRFMSPTVMAPLEPSDEPVRRGQTVVAIGSPKGVKNTVSIGNVSSVYPDEDSGAEMIQFTAPISSGSSGGALLDESGRVIGITSAAYRDAQNLNIAISVADVLDLWEAWDGTEYPIPDWRLAERKRAVPEPTPVPGGTSGTGQTAAPSVVPNGPLTGKESATDEEYYLGMLYFTESAIRDPEKAFEYFHASADKGNASSQFYIGYMYYTGTGVKKNFKEAFDYFHLSARQNNAGAQYYLAEMYYYGDGIRKDLDRAMDYYRMAANQGHAGALCNLGYAYLHGEGVERDYAEAFRCYQLAAEQGDAEAQYSLGSMYENGFYVEKDKDRAIEYYMISSSQGNEDAREALRRLGLITLDEPEPEPEPVPEPVSPSPDDGMFTGTYEMTALVTEEDGDLGDTLAFLKMCGITSTLTFRENSEAVIALFGEELVLRFDPASMEMRNDDGALLHVRADGDTLIIWDEDGSMTFSRPDTEAEPEPETDITGSYELISLVSTDEGDLTEDIALIRGFGLVVTLEVRPDGTATLRSIDDTIELTYEPGKRFMTDEDGTILPFRTEEDGRLVIGDEENYMIFEPVPAS